jgi:hypothetical protein
MPNTTINLTKDAFEDYNIQAAFLPVLFGLFPLIC